MYKPKFPNGTPVTLITPIPSIGHEGEYDPDTVPKATLTEKGTMGAKKNISKKMTTIVPTIAILPLLIMALALSEL